MPGFGERPGVLSGRGRGAARGVGGRWPSGRSRGTAPAAGEDRSAAARRGARVPGRRPPSRPSEPGVSRSRAAPGAPAARNAAGALSDPVRAQSPRGAARSPPRPAARPAAPGPSSLAFWRRYVERPRPSFSLLPSPRLSSGKSGTPDTWVDCPGVPPALGGDPCSRS